MKVPLKLKITTRMMEKLKPFYKALGQAESWVLKNELNAIKADSPIYICSLPRSGTTIISEVLSCHKDSYFHCYHDFPNIFTPYWKRWLKERNPISSQEFTERSHGDRVMVNQESIEAFEEVLWHCFYKDLHGNGLAKKLMDVDSRGFKRYYLNHIKKLQLITGKSRYLSKSNYNINRIDYLVSMFPKAKFLVPIRHPVNHIASLEKQHQLFLKAGVNDSSIDRQLAASGHFEFGHLREIVSFGDVEVDKLLQEKLQEPVIGWAHYWAYFYQQVLKSVNESESLKRAVMFVNYDELCQSTDAVLEKIFCHTNLDHANYKEIKSQYKYKLCQPKYYQNNFTNHQVDQIIQITKSVAGKFGYNLKN